MSRERARGSAHATITETITFGALPGIIALTVLVGLLFGFAQARGGQERAGAAAWAQAELDYLRAQGYEGLATGTRTLTPASGHTARGDTTEPTIPAGFDHAVITVRSLPGVDEKQAIVTLYQAPSVIYATVSIYLGRPVPPGRGM
ncbi:MAG: hypothetical protein E6H00_04490 [Bacillati bacterium ANGP1]|uniref:Pilus assembly protein n=1 Tax=Candidatus Segetimicrobium genomatis TaxID=2569760 RepID=A0A537K678_9BACT|nr:MAG: hypothetical protein E6H00_04490 [Terrabacteria group bacterium ANGP1]